MKNVMYGERKGVLLRVDSGLYGELVRLYGLETRGIESKRKMGSKGKVSFNRYLESILERYVEGQRELLMVYEGLVKRNNSEI